jgi:pyridoxine/pyridoxamine 5'-phosphate oxidase
MKSLRRLITVLRTEYIGRPYGRIMLLRGFDERGFVFLQITTKVELIDFTTAYSTS